MNRIKQQLENKLRSLKSYNYQIVTELSNNNDIERISKELREVEKNITYDKLNKLDDVKDLRNNKLFDESEVDYILDGIDSQLQIIRIVTKIELWI